MAIWSKWFTFKIDSWNIKIYRANNFVLPSPKKISSLISETKSSKCIATPTHLHIFWLHSIDLVGIRFLRLLWFCTWRLWCTCHCLFAAEFSVGLVQYTFHIDSELTIPKIKIKLPKQWRFWRCFIFCSFSKGWFFRFHVSFLGENIFLLNTLLWWICSEKCGTFPSEIGLPAFSPSFCLKRNHILKLEVYPGGVSNLFTGWIIQVLPEVSGDKGPQKHPLLKLTARPFKKWWQRETFAFPLGKVAYF